MNVFVLWYIPPDAEDDDYLLIGVYSSRASAASAVRRLATKRGFANHPEIVEDTDQPGFYVAEYALDEDHWSEGFVSSNEAGFPGIRVDASRP